MILLAATNGADIVVGVIAAFAAVLSAWVGLGVRRNTKSPNGTTTGSMVEGIWKGLSEFQQDAGEEWREARKERGAIKQSLQQHVEDDDARFRVLYQALGIDPSRPPR